MTKKKNWGDFKRCYHSHPPYPVTTKAVIYGGSCISPVVTDADLYIGFDRGMTFTERHYPWNEGVEILHYIQDQHEPGDATEFHELIKYTAKRLREGAKVHAGCIGGHGRTGTFFAALRRFMAKDEDAIAHVRANYCKSAVESKKQVDFLHDVWGIKKQAPSSTYKYKGVKKVGSGKTPSWQYPSTFTESSSLGSNVTKIDWIETQGALWSDNVG